MSRRQFLGVTGMGVLGIALSSSMFGGCTQKHVEVFVDLISELPQLINNYRQQQGLPSIKLSSKLSAVAFAHIRDLSTYHPEKTCGAKGTLHSWSNHGNWQGKNGDSHWKGCCYPDDHSNAPCMWNKPKEIAGYQDYGYEVSASSVSSAQDALNTWKNSSAHNDVILNKGMWSNYQWKAIGALCGGGYACAWFGTLLD